MEAETQMSLKYTLSHALSLTRSYMCLAAKDAGLAAGLREVCVVHLTRREWPLGNGESEVRRGGAGEIDK